MPVPLKPGEDIYVNRKIKQANYAMPFMQTALDYYSISYLVSGDRKWFSYQKVVIAHAGSIGFQQPGVTHQTLPMSHTPYDRYIIKYRKSVVQPVIDLIGEDGFQQLHQGMLHFPKEILDTLKVQFDEMLTEYERHSPYSQLILKGMLIRLILTIYENKKDIIDNTIKIYAFDSRIHDAILYIEGHYADDLTLQGLARVVSLSPAYFSKLFHQITGSSLSAYLTMTRLQHAQILLATTDLSITEIASQCGFSNANYLCNVFKNKIHMSPTEYKKGQNQI